MTISEITEKITIEDLVTAHPRAVSFLMEHGIRCILCGEPAWGTLGDALREKGFTADRKEEVVRMLRDHLSDRTAQDSAVAGQDSRHGGRSL